jgi:hypothetical protein
MKRDFQSKIKAGYALPAIALTGTGPVWAHPEITGHATVTPTAHGMVHAVMNAPLLIAAICVAMGGLYVLLRLRKHWRRTVEPARELDLNRE